MPCQRRQVSLYFTVAFALASSPGVDRGPACAADTSAKTAKQVAIECGLTDSDLNQVPSELYDCIRHYAVTSGKLAAAANNSMDTAEYERDLAKAKQAANGRFAASYVIGEQPRFTLLRDGSGMYHAVKVAMHRTYMVATRDKDVVKDNKRESVYVRKTQSPGEFDRSFLSRVPDGTVYLHEEMCSLGEQSEKPQLYLEKFELDVVEGSWEGYLRGDLAVLRLTPAATAKRQAAQDRFTTLIAEGKASSADESMVEALKEGAEIKPEETPATVSHKKDGGGVVLVYVKRDAMLWVGSESSVIFTSVSAR